MGGFRSATGRNTGLITQRDTSPEWVQPKAVEQSIGTCPSGHSQKGADSQRRGNRENDTARADALDTEGCAKMEEKMG